MKYMIVNWNKEELKWEILHYSHNYTDADRRWGELKSKYPEAQMLVDIFDLRDTEMKAGFKNLMERMAKRLKENE